MNTMTAPQVAPVPLRIHHIEGRRSFRVAWLCEEIGLPYELVFKRGDLMGSMVALRKAHPLCPITPAVEIDGQTIVESGAILDVLAARYAPGVMVPKVDSPDYPLHAQWMHFAEGTLMARISTDLFAAVAIGARLEDMPKGYRHGIDKPDVRAIMGTEQMFRFIEAYLGEHEYFGGSRFSAADIMMQWSLRGARYAAQRRIADYPNLARWHERVESRPAYARTVAAAVPDGMGEYMLPAREKMPFPPLMRGVAGVLARPIGALLFWGLTRRQMLRRWFGY